MSQWPYEIIGQEPRHLIGLPCKAALLQQFWFKGELAEPANVLFLNLGENWTSVSIDAGIIFWRQLSVAPKGISKELAATDCSYPIVDVGKEYRLIGQVLADIISRPTLAGSRVCMLFMGGRQLVLDDVEDCTSLELIDG